MGEALASLAVDDLRPKRRLLGLVVLEVQALHPLNHAKHGAALQICLLEVVSWHDV